MKKAGFDFKSEETQVCIKKTVFDINFEMTSQNLLCRWSFAACHGPWYSSTTCRKATRREKDRSSEEEGEAGSSPLYASAGQLLKQIKLQLPYH